MILFKRLIEIDRSLKTRNQLWPLSGCFEDSNDSVVVTEDLSKNTDKIITFHWHCCAHHFAKWTCLLCTLSQCFLRISYGLWGMSVIRLSVFCLIHLKWF